MFERKYDSLEQRMIAACLETFPPFVPCEGAPGMEAQRAFYEWMGDLYRLLLQQSELLFPSLHPDDCYTNRFNKTLDGKPKLQTDMKAAQKRIQDLMSKLMEIAAQGQTEGSCITVPRTVKLPAAHRRVLAAAGVRETKGTDTVSFDCGSAALAEVWRWMAVRRDTDEALDETAQEDAVRLRFSRCLFQPEYSYAADIFRPLFGNASAYDRLLAFLTENGYTRTENREGRTALDYTKEYGKKPSPLKAPWAERTHGGIAMQYDPMMDEPAFLSLRAPMLADILKRLDEADDVTRRFLLGRTKRCDGCRYCVQVDKTGKRPLSCIPVTDGEKTIRMCPLFPGFTYCWTQLDDELANGLIACLSWIDRCFAK